MRRLSGIMASMPSDEPSSIQTHSSLLNRLRNGDDTAGWQEFYRVYGKLVRDFAIHAGLTDTEADEVVQETAVAMARHLPEYRYNPKVCRFKTWLLNQASWRVKDQLRKRNSAPPDSREGAGGVSAAVPADETTRTSTANRVPDPAGENLDALFEAEWRKSLFSRALEQVKSKFTLKQFQVFDLLVLKEWPPAQVAQSLGISLANVYVIRHRMSAAVKKQVKLLEKQIEQAERVRAEHARAD
jgi:RNA polymerase sigma factor (sigma-70 family)